MKVLWPFIKLIRPYLGWVLLGTVLAIVTLLAAIGLLSLSGWFLTSTALAGMTVLGARSFNYYTPGAGVRGFAILRTLGRYAERVVSHEATFRILARLRSWCFERLEPLGPAGLSGFRSADLLNRIVADVNALDNLYLRVLSPSLVALVVGGLVTLFVSFYDGYLALLLAAALVLAGFLLPWCSYRLGLRSGQSLIRHTAGLRVQLVDLLQGMAELSIYGGLAEAEQRMRQEQAALYGAQQRMARINGFGAALMVLLNGIALLLAVWLGLDLLTAEKLEAAQFAMLVFCVLASFEAIAGLPSAYQYLGKTRLAAERLNELVGTEPGVRFVDCSVAKPVDGSVCFYGVSFGYDDRRLVIKNISFDVAAGTRVAVVGHSGSGKSSLINILARFWPLQGGRVTLGGVDLADLSELDLRAQMAVMGQPVQLFAGSVRDNLQIACAGVDDERLWELMHSVALDQALTEREGLDTDIGDNGVRLSGGQRKRLALARALLSPAPLLVLDEPFEGVDAATEKRLVELLNRELGERTLLLITHHLNHLECFDQVLVMDDGHIVERGEPAKLMAATGGELNRLRLVE